MVTPSVVGVGNELCSETAVNSNYVTFEILLIPVVLPLSRCAASIAVLHSYRRAVYVVEVNYNIITPYFGCYLCAVKYVGVLNSIYGLTSPYSLIVVGKCKVLVTFCGSFESSALPSEAVVGSVVIR